MGTTHDNYKVADAIVCCTYRYINEWDASLPTQIHAYE